MQRHPASMKRLAIFLVVGCSAGCQANDATTFTGVPPTVLVINGSCAAGHCDSVEILGFPANGPVIPAGLWSVDLGLMTGPQLCVRLPPSARFVVSGPVNGVMRSDTTIWTPAISLSLGSIAPSGLRWMAGPTTAGFVPANAAGWHTTLPGPQVSSDTACTP